MRDPVKDVYSRALFYLSPASPLGRSFALCVLSIFLFLIGMFAWYTEATALGLHSSWIYGRSEFKLDDRHYAELFGYMLEAFIALLFILKAWRDKQPHWLCWAAIFIIIIADDSLQLHESIGRLIKAEYGISKNIGEIVGFAGIGVFITAIWSIGILQIVKKRDEQIPYLVFSFYLGALIFFGVGVDALHIFLGRYGVISDLTAHLVEDGGELLFTCLCAITAISFYAEEPKPTTV